MSHVREQTLFFSNAKPKTKKKKMPQVLKTAVLHEQTMKPSEETMQHKLQKIQSRGDAV